MQLGTQNRAMVLLGGVPERLLRQGSRHQGYQGGFGTRLSASGL